MKHNMDIYLAIGSFMLFSAYADAVDIYNPGSITINNFAVTDGYYSSYSDINSAVQDSLGSGYRIADWIQVEQYFNEGNSADEFIALMGGNNLWVSRNGSEFYSGNRRYFIHFSDHNTPPNFLVHDTIDNNLIDLGSWWGAMPVLVYTSSAAGLDPSNPILPSPDDDPSDGFDFELTLGNTGAGLSPDSPLWIDPVYAVGYEYTVSGSTFGSAILPPGYGDDLYSISWWDDSNASYVLLDSGHDGGLFAAGEIINFLTLVDPQGISRFKVEEIELSTLLDPSDPSAFMTGLSFTAGGTLTLNMMPITQYAPSLGNVPEPGVLVLIGSGFLAFGGYRRRRH
jgi:hypothetical protein